MLIKLYGRAFILKNFLIGPLQYSIPPTIAKNNLLVNIVGEIQFCANPMKII